MHESATPFQTAWWGIDLEDAGLAELRPYLSTYGKYDYASLPPLPYRLDAQFGWLQGMSPCNAHIASDERASEYVIHLENLIRSSGKVGQSLPAEFLNFFTQPALIERVRTCTDCFIDLCPALVPSPIGTGHLVRFLADSQGCLFWYLYLPEKNHEHCVVVSTGFYGLPEEEWQDEPPDPSEICVCAPSFEAFIGRFVIENELWFTVSDGDELGPAEQSYVASYLAMAAE